MLAAKFNTYSIRHKEINIILVGTVPFMLYAKSINTLVSKSESQQAIAKCFYFISFSGGCDLIGCVLSAAQQKRFKSIVFEL